MSSSKISIGLATAALLVSLLFATPLGQAAGRLVIPKNAVGAAQIKKNAVNGLKVKNGSLTAADFKAGQLPKGPKGDPGAKGTPGAQGAKGEKGDPGATKVTKRTGIGLAAGVAGYSNASVSCQPGETLVGGGAIYNVVPPGDPTLTRSGPTPGMENNWIASFRNDGPAGSVTAYAYALCASP